MRSNVEWTVWGERDPLYGVAAWEGREKHGAQPWTEDEFYALGALDWADYFSKWRNYGVDTQSCIEVGCGAGRITVHLSKTFTELVAVDVSPAMIERARQRVGADVRLLVTDGVSLPIADASVTAAFSSFVFQHFDTPEGANANWREIARVLNPGGTLMVQLPLHGWPSTPQIFRALYRTEKMLGDVRARLHRRRLKAGKGKPFMRKLSYEVAPLLQDLTTLGFGDLTLLTFQVRSNGDFHTFVLAKRR